MSKINITVTDAAQSQRHSVSVPDDAPVVRIIAALIKELKMPLTSPDGTAMSYKFLHKESAKQLNDSTTLAQSSVTEGDTLSLIPEIIAG
jgi:uncharacterized ubiquitin-like protein YukD